MSKINNKSINYGFKILTILAFVLIFVPFNKAMAAPSWEPGHFNTNGSYTFGDFYWPQSAPAAQPTPTVNSNTNAGGSSNDNSNLEANALFGSNGFMPSGLMQWILFAILILLIVILVRKIYGADKRYHAAPMKHK